MAFKGVGCDYQPEHTGHGTLCHSHSTWRCTPQVIQGWGCLLSAMRDPWKIEECESRQLWPCENVLSVCTGTASMSHSMCVLVGVGWRMASTGSTQMTNPRQSLIESQGKNTNLCSVPWCFVLYLMKVTLFAAWINNSITTTRQPFQFVQHVSAKHRHWVTE